jgi:DNA polymerase III delta subunit
VFKMIDAVVEGRKQEALRSLHILLNEQEPQGVFALFVRHFRYLILVRELLDKGGKPAAIAESVHLPDWQVEKLINQLRRFKMDRLSKVYHQLLRMDVDSKSGGTPIEVALDELVLTV